MKMGHMVLALSLGVTAGAGCGKGDDQARVADSIRVADSLRADSTAKAAALVAASDSASKGGTTPGGTAPANPRPKEVIVNVVEETPGLLAQAKVLPIDAQHIALTKYPEGTAKTAKIGRRGRDLVYTYGITQKGVEGAQDVLVNAMDGSLIGGIPRTAEQAKEDAKNAKKNAPKKP